MKKIILFLVLFICTANIIKAGIFRAGEITYNHISGLTYEFKLVSYTDLISYPEVTVECGDGNLDTLTLSNVISLPNGLKKNEYIGFHTYADTGVYIISFESANRNYGIFNIPLSDGIPFFIETTLVINPILSANNSTVLNNSPIDTACVGQLYIYNPTAYDMDGDSIVYILDMCKGESGLDIPGYFLPSGIAFDINTGDFIWNSPQSLGCYNFAIRIEEYRNSVFIGSVLQELQVKVTACLGIKEVINGENEISVFPNPFNTSAILQVSKPLQSATLVIYDILGKEVKRIEGLSGKEITIQRESMKTGMYFYTLRDKQEVIGNGKMMVE